eukprot:TRINITY_DN67258_c3_g1_i1.p1 TRINITY_DN67258_c3_g1~~TRINITY_DN67258_c3_g1_i1.p1  ORF type:complete len:203 (+),score=17.50 TRINITY_DN67258_c3_g1_i1:537-1145(+)
MGSSGDITWLKGKIRSSLQAFTDCWEEKFSPWLEPPVVWAGLLDPTNPGIAATLLGSCSDRTAPFGQQWTLQPNTLQHIQAGKSLWTVDKLLAQQILQTFAPLKVQNVGAESVFRVQKARSTERRMASQALIGAEIRFQKNPTLSNITIADVEPGGDMHAAFVCAKVKYNNTKQKYRKEKAQGLVVDNAVRGNRKRKRTVLP